MSFLIAKTLVIGLFDNWGLFGTCNLSPGVFGLFGLQETSRSQLNYN